MLQFSGVMMFQTVVGEELHNSTRKTWLNDDVIIPRKGWQT
jgi:hypothetical protein